MAPSLTGPAVHVEVPYYSQFKPGNGFTPGRTACLKAASAMVSAAGASMLPGANNRIQTRRFDEQGNIVPDSTGAERGRQYIDQQLALNRPVVVGVNHKPGSLNADNITDHFVVVTGRGVDAQGRTYYSFHDPGTENTSRGSDTNPNNRLYLDLATQSLSRPGNLAVGAVTDRTYDMSMVRLNAP
ncbi:hypothetical protein [Hyalangium versicolor]|uniref:hypothetical protein n=1 Tax=Hyalangium versicolor TaxID=2861190 RepID=UPI001CCC80B3|nr:hypothetical protein [Hyalangium versicolor]